MDSVLVVGASGILAPAAATLVAQGITVTGVGRSRSMPAGVEALYVDATDAEAFCAALGGRRWSAAVGYGPAVSQDTIDMLAASADRVVLVRTTEAAGVGRSETTMADLVLQLGWAVDVDSARWHTPEEISLAVLEVLADGQSRTLGEVQPWENRP